MDPPRFPAGCPTNVTQLTAPGALTAAASWSAPSATDNVGVTSLSASLASGSVFALGDTLVHYTAKDAAGNAASCAFAVRVVAQPVAVVTGPASLLLPAATATGALNFSLELLPGADADAVLVLSVQASQPEVQLLHTPICSTQFCFGFRVC